MKIKILVSAILAVLIGLLVKISIQPDSLPITMLSEKEAVNIVLAEYPQLAIYQTTDLPPSSIETIQSHDGWYLGFIRQGSGVPGILDAKCYYIHNNKTISFIGEFVRENSNVVDSINLETCESVTEIAQVIPESPNTKTGLRLGESGNFDTISIIPLSIEEDSRCPSDVNCIQAGTVRLKIQVVSSIGTSTNTVELNQVLTTAGMNITLTEVSPLKNSKIITTKNEYRFIFTVTKQETSTVTDTNNACYRGGCSSQICSDQPNMMSTCEFKEEYACYRNALCERQLDNRCGWTQTPDLRTCLSTQSI